MADVFISYSRCDKDFVHILHDALVVSKFQAWIDWQDIAPTAEWWQEIGAGIEAAHTFYLLLAKTLSLLTIAVKKLPMKPWPVPAPIKPLSCGT